MKTVLLVVNPETQLHPFQKLPAVSEAVTLPLVLCQANAATRKSPWVVVMFTVAVVDAAVIVPATAWTKLIVSVPPLCV
jgi:hypothetical protein